MEACDILQLPSLPRVHVLSAAAQPVPRAHLLSVPSAWATGPAAAPAAATAANGGSGRATFAWQRQGLLVLSRSLLALEPQELQAALGSALLPLRAPGA